MKGWGGMSRIARILVSLLVFLPLGLHGQVSSDRLLNAAKEPQNWLTYNGTYAAHRHSTLRQVDPTNVTNLELKWMWQSQTAPNLQTTPLVVDGIMYLTQPPTTSLRSTPRAAAFSGSTTTRPRPTRGPAVPASSTGDSRFTATRSSWPRSMRISWPWMPGTAGRCGKSRSPSRKRAT